MNLSDRNLFIVNTPLNLLFAIRVFQTYASDFPAIFLIVNDYQTAPYVASRLPQVLGDSAIVASLPARNSFWGRLAYQILSGETRWHYAIAKLIFLIPQYLAVRKACHLLRDTQLQRLFIFDDAAPYIQGIMSFLKKKHPQIQFIYVEDGMGAYYESAIVPQLKKQMNSILRLVFGEAVEIIQHQGEHSFIEEGIVLEPDKVNVGLKNKKLVKMPLFDFDESSIDYLLKSFSKNPFEVASIEKAALICAPRSNVVTEDFLHYVQQIVHDLHKDGITVFFKYHPEEPKGDYLSIGEVDNVIIVDKTIPAELVCARLGNRMKQIYTEFSSVLFTAKWVNPTIERYMIVPAKSQSKLKSQKLFDNLVLDGVQVIR